MKRLGAAEGPEGPRGRRLVLVPPSPGGRPRLVADHTRIHWIHPQRTLAQRSQFFARAGTIPSRSCETSFICYLGATASK